MPIFRDKAIKAQREVKLSATLHSVLDREQACGRKWFPNPTARFCVVWGFVGFEVSHYLCLEAACLGSKAPEKF